MELPPRTRRIPAPINSRHCSRGTTSAYAENTPYRPQNHAAVRNYLRVRGEYCLVRRCRQHLRELPPRTRRIRPQPTTAAHGVGTTSAYAENTEYFLHHPVVHWNYLRVRGEYRFFRPGGHPDGELPPRTRRILAHRSRPKLRAGTTSAYAENTIPEEWGMGDDGELPPRTRRILWCSFRRLKPQGTTSAYAENTSGAR